LGRYSKFAGVDDKRTVAVDAPAKGGKPLLKGRSPKTAPASPEEGTTGTP
jgi:hypothetical protein